MGWALAKPIALTGGRRIYSCSLDPIARMKSMGFALLYPSYELRTRPKSF